MRIMNYGKNSFYSAFSWWRLIIIEMNSKSFLPLTSVTAVSRVFIAGNLIQGFL